MGLSDIQTIRRAGAVHYFLAMLLAGLFVYFLHRDQHTHASPPAIAISVVAASIVASGVGWASGSAYLNRRLWVSTIAVPIGVLIGATVTAAICYHFTSAIIRDIASETLSDPGDAIHSILNGGFAYLAFSAPVWVITLSIATMVMRRVASIVSRK